MKTIKVYQNESYKNLGDLYGLFFEDINHAADGGLYAELIQNRSFEFDPIDRGDYHSLTAWEKSENVQWKVCEEAPLNAENKHYLNVCAKEKGYILNLGFNTGVFIESGKKYDFSIFARIPAKCGASHVEKIKVSVKNEDGLVNTTVKEIKITGSEWSKY